MARDVALVTGAWGGMGGALARRLARDGRPLVLVARRADRLESLARALRGAHGVEAHVFAQDLLQPGAVQAGLAEGGPRGPPPPPAGGKTPPCPPPPLPPPPRPA